MINSQPYETFDAGLAAGDVVVWLRDDARRDIVIATQGTVVSVIPSDVHPLECGPWADLDLPLFARNHESYIVLATTGRYYWPRVALLHHVGRVSQ